ncbi:hypothetical protein POM88_024468 [Heracleum sosnowskyi]|uniref:F-box domain-containing protein n=1 Tax=Heracleum sosnowskyi TaxID=360622 RepID=A0AAD8I228_9APIA|nr:hypothetical protein POM88_024468 [Heracleum sosnowskyi]
MSDQMFFDAPFDIVECIFTHLPVKNLLSYRLVSKSYRDLIDSRYFANLHWRHSIRTRSNRIILCRCEGIASVGSDAGMHRVDFDTLRHSVLKCPMHWDYFSQFIGSCNGVVLLYDGYEHITFWNPTIRTYIDLIHPRASIPQNSNGNLKYNFGFGYDHFSDDYKVLMSVQLKFTAVLNGEDIVKEAYVFSLKSNIWRRIGDFPYFVRNTGCHGTYVDGSLYWNCVERTVDSNFRNLIVAFDLVTEEYRVIQTPVYEDINSEVGITIGSLEGSLWAHCFLVVGGEEDLAGISDVWILQQRDEEEYSWTRILSFDDPIKFCKPLAYSKRGKNVLLDNQMNLLWYDLGNGKEGRKLKIRGLPAAYYGSDVCVESLVHLDGDASAEENLQHKREKKVVEDEIGRSNEGSSLGFDSSGEYFTTLTTMIRVTEYSDTAVAEFLYRKKPTVRSLIELLCKDLSKACTTKPLAVPKVAALYHMHARLLRTSSKSINKIIGAKNLCVLQRLSRSIFRAFSCCHCVLIVVLVLGRN